MKFDLFLREAGFMVKRILGDKFPKVILSIVESADYDINLLFRGVK